MSGRLGGRLPDWLGGKLPRPSGKPACALFGDPLLGARALPFSADPLRALAAQRQFLEASLRSLVALYRP